MVEIRFGVIWLCPQPELHGPCHVTSAQDPAVSPGPAGDRLSSSGRRIRTQRDFSLPPTAPSSRYPTLGSPRGYLTPSLGSSFLWAGGRSTASHIPKETVGSYEKVGLTLGSLFIAPHARRSHASVPQRSCTGLFIFPPLRFPLGRPSQECRLVWQTWGSRGGSGMSQRHLRGCGCAVALARPRLGAQPPTGNGLSS